MKKYELTKETVTISEKTLYRIRAVRDFGSVKTGDLGGYIEKEENLSHFDDAWVSGNAKVFDNAEVSGNGKVFDNAEVSGNGKVSGNAEVSGNGKVSGNAWVSDNAEVSGNGKVSGNANVFDNARISGNAEIFNTRHFCTQGPIGSRNGFVTFYRTKDNTVEVKCGCFLGSLQEFVNQVEKTHKGNKYEKEYKLAAELAKVCIRLEGKSK
jgi:hypothetical protein